MMKPDHILPEVQFSLGCSLFVLTVLVAMRMSLWAQAL